MDDEKYTRSVRLQCPTCGSNDFEYDENSPNDDASITVKCNNCGRETSKAQLIEDNQQNIEAELDEMKKEIFSDIESEFKKLFK